MDVLSFLKLQRPDVVIVDAPGDGGELSLIQRLREVTGGAPLVLVSDGIMPKAADAEYLEADDVLERPFSDFRLRSCVVTQTRLSRSEENLARVAQTMSAEALEARDAFIGMFCALIEYRNQPRGQHLDRMQAATRLLLTAYQRLYPERAPRRETADAIVQASILHDIGSVGVPDAILLKPGRLTPEEYDIMKKHTTVGARSLSWPTLRPGRPANRRGAGHHRLAPRALGRHGLSRRPARRADPLRGARGGGLRRAGRAAGPARLPPGDDVRRSAGRDRRRARHELRPRPGGRAALMPRGIRAALQGDAAQRRALRRRGAADGAGIAGFNRILMTRGRDYGIIKTIFQGEPSNGRQGRARDGAGIGRELPGNATRQGFTGRIKEEQHGKKAHPQRQASLLRGACPVLVYAVLFGLGSLLSYIGAAVVFYIGYKVLKKKYRDRTVTVERAPHSGDEGCDALILEGREALLKIRDANARIPDPELSRRIDSIEESCRQIFKRLEEQPKLQQNLRSFLRYYLPTTLKLLEARAQLDSGAQSQTARDVRRRTSEALAMVDDAFKKQLAALDEYRFLDLETEMDVLNSMLRQDGFVQPEAYAGAGASGGTALPAGRRS